jgi:hypothetical protein
VLRGYVVPAAGSVAGRVMNRHKPDAWMVYEDLWTEIWEQLPGALQRQAERGDLRFGIQCDDVTEGPRVVRFMDHASTCLDLTLPADGRLTDGQIAQLCVTF